MPTWSDIGPVASALSFIVVFWLAVRTIRAERPRRSIYNVERRAEPGSIHGRVFALLVRVDLVNVSRTSNAIINAQLIVSGPEGRQLVLKLTPPLSATLQGGGQREQYLIGNTWWPPPYDTVAASLPIPIGGLAAVRADLVGQGPIDDLVGKEATDELIRLDQQPAGVLTYTLELRLQDVQGKWYVWPRGASRRSTLDPRRFLRRAAKARGKREGKSRGVT